MSTMKVSIICNTFNHEKYISRVLQGFVDQKTTFDYEVLVHDDASTDNTAAIIKDFQYRYPSIIKPIYETQNQWSISPRNIMDIQLKRVQGDYIAFCEGDDYWIDPNKLQYQVEALKRNRNSIMCAHAAYTYVNGKKKSKIQPYKEDKILGFEETMLGGGGYLATNSILVRTDAFLDMPDFMNLYDYTIQMYGALKGGIVYINRFMSIYNFMNENSWSKRRKTDVSYSIKMNNMFIDIFNKLNEYTNFKYKALIDNRIKQYLFENKWYSGKLKDITKDKDIMDAISKRDKFKLSFRMRFPALYDFLWSIKYSI